MIDDAPSATRTNKFAMHVPITIAWVGGSTKAAAFCGTGAIGGNTMSIDFATRSGIRVTMSPPKGVSGFTGDLLTTAIGETDPLILTVGPRHVEKLTFKILEDQTYPIILGFEWFHKHNPVLDFRVPALTFSRCTCPRGMPSSVPAIDAPIAPSAPKSTVLNLTPERIQPARTDKADHECYIKDDDDWHGLVPNEVNRPPMDDREFSDVSPPVRADTLPEHRLSSCAIIWQDDKIDPPHWPIPSRTHNETTALDEYPEMVFFRDKKPSLPRRTRWALRLGIYDLVPSFRPGVSNTAANASTRRSDLDLKEGCETHAESVLPVQCCSAGTMELLILPLASRKVISANGEQREIIRAQCNSSAVGHYAIHNLWKLIAWALTGLLCAQTLQVVISVTKQKPIRHKSRDLLPPLPILTRPPVLSWRCD